MMTEMVQQEMTATPSDSAAELFSGTTEEDAVTLLESRDQRVEWHVGIYYVIGIIGMLDNGLVIFVIMMSKRMRQKVCNLFIINQSVIDFTASFWLIVNSPSVVSLHIPSGISGEIYCRVWANSFLMWTSFVISTGNLIMMTLERFAEIVHPLRYKVHFTKTRGMIAIVLVWILGAVIQFAHTGYTSIPVGNFCALYVAYPSEAIRIFSSILRYIIAIILPVTVMTYCYTRMIQAMRKVQPALESVSASERVRQQRQDKVRRNLLKAMLTVCVAYVMCVGWNQTYFLLINLGVNLPFGTPFYHFTVYALFLNCLINPIIYTAKYREFQLSVKKMSKQCLPCISTVNQIPNAEETATDKSAL